VVAGHTDCASGGACGCAGAARCGGGGGGPCGCQGGGSPARRDQRTVGTCRSDDAAVRTDTPPVRVGGQRLRAGDAPRSTASATGLSLFPAPLGAVPRGLPLAEALRRVPPERGGAGGLLRARSGGVGVVHAHPAFAGASKGVGPWYTARDPHTSELGYRTERFFVPTKWLARYTRDLAETRAKDGGTKDPVGLVSSVSDALAALLPEYLAVRQATGVSSGDLGALIGCWNLPRSGNADRYYFWHDGWGAPHRFFLNTCWLIVGYAGFIEDPTRFGNAPKGMGFSPMDEWCRDFGPFVRRLLSGREATNLAGVSCRPTIKIKGGESDRSATTNCDPDVQSCGNGFNPGSCDGLAWDDWTAHFDNGNWIWRFKDDSGLSWEMPVNPCENYMTGGDDRWLITAQAGHLSAHAMVADWVLYQARLAWDFYRAGEGNARYVEVGRRLARYALRLMVEWGTSVVHEAGHCFTGVGGHCDFGACFDIAAEHWKWKVVGALGLPVQPYLASDVTDFPEVVHREVGTRVKGGNDTGVSHYYDYRLYLESAGTVGGRATMCVTRSYCEDDDGGVIDFAAYGIETCSTMTLDEVDDDAGMTLVEEDVTKATGSPVGDPEPACFEWRDGALVIVPCDDDKLPADLEGPYGKV
jgi:hypothetical protein